MSLIGPTCRSDIALPVQPTEEVDNIWTIAKTDTALIITCNGVEVANFVFDSGGSQCVSTMGGDIVEKIQLRGTGSALLDTASDLYRAGNTGP